MGFQEALLLTFMVIRLGCVWAKKWEHWSVGVGPAETVGKRKRKTQEQNIEASVFLSASLKSSFRGSVSASSFCLLQLCHAPGQLDKAKHWCPGVQGSPSQLSPGISLLTSNNAVVTPTCFPESRGLSAVMCGEDLYCVLLARLETIQKGLFTGHMPSWWHMPSWY